MLTDGVNDPLVTMVNVLLVAVSVFAQIALLVMTTVTTSLLTRVVVVNMELLVPTLAPLIFH